MARVATKKGTTKKVRVTAKHIAEHRNSSSKAPKDLSPSWEGCAEWDSEKFSKTFRDTLNYYRLDVDSKAMKPTILRWLTDSRASAEDVAAFKKLKDNRIGSTIGGVAACLLNGMPPIREEFNGGRDSAAWLVDAIKKAIEEGKNDIDDEEVAAVKAEKKAAGTVITIQDRVREASLAMTDEIEDAIESFHKDPERFNPSEFKVLNLLKGKGVKAAHARIIKAFYTSDLVELTELASGKGCEQLIESYSHRTKKQIRALIQFYVEIHAACDMLAEEAKVNRAPRAKKLVAKDKLVAKLKFKKTDEMLKLVSINPVDIIGAKELWVFDSKTRKLGRYVAAEFADLGIKGTTITGFDDSKSIQKTLRKPPEQLKAFKDAGKVALRKFLDDINAVDIKLNGRISDNVMLLKVA